MPTDRGNNLGLYLVNTVAGNDAPGDPKLHISLTVNAVTGAVTGQGAEKQALPPPLGNIQVSDIIGRINEISILVSDVPHVVQVVHLKGSALGEYIAAFEAHFVVDSEWNGTGSWKLGKNDIKNVPIHEVGSKADKNAK